MSTTSLERTDHERTDNVSRGRNGSGGAPPKDTEQSNAGSRLYRVVWRWHFYAGMIVAPVLIVVAATGALYIFKDELERLVYPQIMVVEPTGQRVSYQEQMEAVRAAAPPNARFAQLLVNDDPTRATSFAVFSTKFENAYVDPYTGKYLGSIDLRGFFDVVLTIHRQLFIGTTGRIAVELVTCWTVVLLITGTYLWWPRKPTQVWGVWLPRLRKHPYVILRDLHSVGGIYVALVSLVIALTGMMYTYAWGGGFNYVAQKTDTYELFTKPTLCTSPPEAKDLPLDRIVEVAREQMPGYSHLTVWFPRVPNAAYMIFASSGRGPSVHELVFVDGRSGEVLGRRTNSQTKPLYWFGSWNYPLHVGSILGMPTKILWFVACLALMALPVTGIWMWWERRPRGKLGLPRRPVFRLPRWLAATITALCVVLPMMGISVIVLLLGELVVSRIRRAWAA